MKAIISRFRPTWQIPLLATLVASAVLVGLFLYSPNGSLFYIFILAPILCVTLFSLLLVAAISRQLRSVLIVLFTSAGLFAASWLLLRNEGILRRELRWLFRSRLYKAELLAHPSVGSELRHLEWDTWGIVPSGFDTVYLVYDPTDSLRSSAGSNKPVRVNGIPCEVPAIRRLERQWYWVLFYTDEDWGHCPYSDKPPSAS